MRVIFHNNVHNNTHLYTTIKIAGVCAKFPVSEFGKPPCKV